MTISILQWNVWFREDPFKLADYLATVGADVLCLQELTTTSPDNPDFDIPEYLAERLVMHKVYAEAQRWETAGRLKRTQGNVILSRLPVVAKRSVWIQESDGPSPAYDGEGRVYVEAELAAATDRRLTVATTHLSYVHNFGTSPRWEREGDKLIETIGRRQQNYVVTADLNALPDSALIQQISQRCGVVNAGPEYGVKTWATKPFTFGGSTDNILKWRLDYVFASPDVRVVEARVLQTDLSDHLPVLVTVEI